MTQVFLSTTGTPPTVTINDIGGISFAHPIVNLPLLLPNGFLKESDLIDSADIITAITNGEITLIDDAGNTITNTDDLVSSATAAQNSAVFEWKFLPATDNSDPGVGNFKLNMATQSNATVMFINSTASNGADFDLLFETVRSGDKLYIQETQDPSRYIVIEFTSIPADLDGWWVSAIAVNNAGSPIRPDKVCTLTFTLSLALGAKNSLQLNLNEYQLVNDSLAPGNNQYYGTNENGTKGFFDLAELDDMPAVKARRTTQLNPIPTGALTSLTFDVTDIENAPDIIEHNNIDTEFLDIKESGLYLIFWALSADDEVDADVADAFGNTVPGSFYSVGDKTDATQIFAGSAKAVIGMLMAGDQITLRVQAVTGAEFILADATFMAVRLRGTKGDKGDQGDPGVGTITIAEQGSDVASGIDRINILSPFFFWSILGGSTSADLNFNNNFAVAEYRNTNTSNNLNNSTATTFNTVVPIIGTQIRLDPDFFASGSNGLGCNFDGWVKAEANIHITSGGQRNAIQIRFKLNGTVVGPVGSTGYMRNATGHAESSLHISCYIPVSNGDIISLHSRRESTNATSTFMDLAGTSNMILTRTPEV